MFDNQYKFMIKNIDYILYIDNIYCIDCSLTTGTSEILKYNDYQISSL